MSRFVLRAASLIHERSACTKLFPMRLIHQHRKRLFENQTLKKTGGCVSVHNTVNDAADVPDDRKLTSQKLKDLMNKKEVLLIDVRGRSEVKKTGLLPNSVNIPAGEYGTAMKVPDSMFKFKYGFTKPKPHQTIVFVCSTGLRSSKALRAALDMGYESFSTSTQQTPGPSVKISPDKHLSYKDVTNLIDRKEILLIDVRDPHELQETGELPGSINVPLNELKFAFKEMSDADFQKRYGAKKPAVNAPLVFSCRSGARSLKALQLALDLGYNRAKHYKGGFLDWAENTKSKRS